MSPDGAQDPLQQDAATESAEAPSPTSRKRGSGGGGRRKARPSGDPVYVRVVHVPKARLQFAWMPKIPIYDEVTHELRRYRSGKVQAGSIVRWHGPEGHWPDVCERVSGPDPDAPDFRVLEQARVFQTNSKLRSRQGTPRAPAALPQPQALAGAQGQLGV